MREPLMITPLGHGTHPHFKLPQAQGWALKRCDNAVVWLGQKEAKRLRHRRRRDGLDSGRVLEVRKTLDDLLTEVAAGSELLYDGLLASSLDGQPLVIAIEAHLGRPAIPAAAELLRGQCTAAGLCLERAECTLREQTAALQERAAAVQEAVERSQRFWHTMLDGLPAGCRRPLSSSCRWRRRAYCRHQGRRLCLGEPPWQATANAAVTAPHAAPSSANSFELSTVTRARLSGGCAARCSGCTCSRVPPFGGDGGLVVAVPRGLRQQCRLGLSCLARSPVIFGSQAVLLRLVHLTRQRTQRRGR